MMSGDGLTMCGDVRVVAIWRRNIYRARRDLVAGERACQKGGEST